MNSYGCENGVGVFVNGAGNPLEQTFTVPLAMEELGECSKSHSERDIVVVHDENGRALD